MSRRSAEFKRILEVTWVALGALFSFVPFTFNLLLSLVLGRRFRKRVCELMENSGEVAVDEAQAGRPPARVYLLAGEDSGDLHAANLVKALRRKAPELEVRGMGGPRMQEAGCKLDFDLASLNVMGILPVIKSVGKFFGLYLRLLRMFDEDPPDVLVPVDYPGFNLRIARSAKRRGIRVVYYISPQIWAWAPWRIRGIARSVDRMLAILPFERGLYEDGGVPCAFVGHPLYEHLEEVAPAAGERGPRDADSPTIGLLPGSRRAEVRGVLPQMVRAAGLIRSEYPAARFVIPFRRESLEAEIREHLGADFEAELIRGRTHEVMRGLDAAMVASGTASLELAYYRIPMAVLYRVGVVGAVLKRIALITPYVALVNIVGGGGIVPEYVGRGDYSRPSAEALLGFLAGGSVDCREGLEDVRRRLHSRGVADRAGRWVLNCPASSG